MILNNWHNSSSLIQGNRKDFELYPSGKTIISMSLLRKLRHRNLLALTDEEFYQEGFDSCIREGLKHLKGNSDLAAYYFKDAVSYLLDFAYLQLTGQLNKKRETRKWL